MSKFISRGEKEFITGCTKAILKCDTSKEHRLYEIKKGIREYRAVSDINLDFVHHNGEAATCICVIGEELIRSFHWKAGDDDLARPWIKRAVKDVIIHGESVAYNIYDKEGIHLDKLFKEAIHPKMTKEQIKNYEISMRKRILEGAIEKNVKNDSIN
ncbi:hypothetical protein [Salipaludibacillus sp. CF4.18]|uniref:hypothetical protein n=1 Tax=Salipaludibacillus sp. CF4.18 TaxID=3373081 RepID=UPI003EE61605